MTSRSGGELPQLELDCLAALWALGAAPVAAVRQHLAGHGRSLAYTTVLTVLDRLRRKQAVARQRRGRAYVYMPLLRREQIRERALDRLIHNYFDSRAELGAYLRGETAATPVVPVAAPAPEPEPEPAFLD
ncbi:MAG: BlaI/MecI/CopY family transcriptional regulator [Terriglobales bacterium]